eukprot:SAG31_NODE_1281_length_9019_cov_4.758072_1_plen_487_part_00
MPSELDVPLTAAACRQTDRSSVGAAVANASATPLDRRPSGKSGAGSEMDGRHQGRFSAPAEAQIEESVEPCPYGFVLTRASKRVVSPWWVVPALGCAGVANLAITVACPQWADPHHTCTPVVSDAPLIAIDVVSQGFAGIALLLGVPATLRNLLLGPAPTGGALERLGEQAQWTLLTPPRGQFVAVSMVLGYRLRYWACLGTVIAAMVAAGSTPLHVFDAASLLAGGDILGGIVSVIRGVNFGIVIPLFISWWLTLKQGAAFAMREIRRIRGAIQRYAVGSPDWEAKVVQGIKTLVQCTLPSLSAGWAGGALIVCVGIWLGTLCRVAKALQQPQLDALIANLALAAFYSCIPALVLWDVANASSECDLLCIDLNFKRLDESSDSTHLAIVKLETMLGKLNKHQGPGFVMFGIVVDKRLFFSLLVKLGMLGSTASATFLALRHSEQSSGINGCQLTKEQQALIRALFGSFNAGGSLAMCPWNSSSFL